jgi:hypothetical protein
MTHAPQQEREFYLITSSARASSAGALTDLRLIHKSGERLELPLGISVFDHNVATST